MKNRLSFALLAASALALAGCSSINTALNTSKQPSMEKLTPPSGQAFLTLEGSGHDQCNDFVFGDLPADRA